MSKAEKMRDRLASIQRDREEFEKQRKELEAEMAVGKQNMGKIKKGLKNNEIVKEQIMIDSPSNAGAEAGALPRKASRKDSTTGKPPTSAASFHVNNAAFGGAVVPSSSSVYTGSAIMPSGARVSDWCFTGTLESSPPVVKSREIYENVRHLGRGAFGEVILVKNVEDNKL